MVEVTRPVRQTTAQHHLLLRAEKIGLLMRHTANVCIIAVALVDPDSTARPAGRWLLAALLAWSSVRLLTRSLRPGWWVADFGWTVAVCLAIPWLTADPEFFLTNSAPQAIAGTAVVSFSVCLPIRFTLPMTLAIAAGYAYGVAGVSGWERVASVMAVYYFALQWITASLIRLMVLRVAAVVDGSREARETAEVGRRVQSAVHDFEREQLSLLHDTAASTLLMVGQGVDLPRDRLAAQARRDLNLLRENAWQSVSSHIDVVAALRDVMRYSRTEAQLCGPDTLWVAGPIGRAVVSAAREAINNVDRHAAAGLVLITVAPDRVVITDDGIGFEADSPRSGRGITDSISQRMRDVGGRARVGSTPGHGTCVELDWPPTVPAPAYTDLSDGEGLIQRVRLFYGAGLVVYAVANLLTTVPYTVGRMHAPTVEWVLAAVAASCAIAALPVLRGRLPALVPVGVMAAIGVVIGQSILLPAASIGSHADWVQAGIGWCVLPLVLTRPYQRAGAVLVGLWVLGAVLELVRNPVASAWVNVGLGTGSILTVQFFAMAFGGLLSDAAAAVRADVRAHHAMAVAERITAAVEEDYRRRYATLVDGVIPVLELLGATGTADAALQRRARAESSRLRVLFDQSKTFDHPLMAALRPVIDAAEVRDIDVTVDVSGVLPNPDDAISAHLVDVARCALGTQPVSAHMVVTGSPQTLSMSIVCRQVAEPGTVADELLGCGAEVIVDADILWVIVERPVSEVGQTQ